MLSPELVLESPVTRQSSPAATNLLTMISPFAYKRLILIMHYNLLNHFQFVYSHSGPTSDKAVKVVLRTDRGMLTAAQQGILTHNEIQS